jgi:hypothetical protein
MKGNKIGTIFLISVLALAGIGFSYAGFTDILTVEGTVQTGEVEFNVFGYSGTWVFKIYGFPDGYPLTAPPGTPDEYDLGKEILIYRGYTDVDDDYPGEPAVIAWATANYGTAELIASALAHNSITEDDHVTFEFVNLFPCINFVADFEFTVSSIPVKVTEITYGVYNGLEWMETLIANGDIYATMWDENDNQVTVGYQIHPGDVITVKLYIHIPQNDIYQQLSGSGWAKIGVVQWTDPCDTVYPNKVVNLPDFSVNMVVAHPWHVPPSYLKTTISGTGHTGLNDDYNVWDGDWVGWCVDETYHITPGKTYTVKLWSTYDGDMPWPNPNWMYVNYIINNKPATYTWQEMQSAMWYFVDGGAYPSDPDAQAIVDDAIANGYGFVPKENQWCAVLCQIIDPATGAELNVQRTFIEVDP